MFCIFEYVYFVWLDFLLDGIFVYKIQMWMG